jgi:hypothetical protein
MTNQLTEEQFKATMTAKMVNMPDTAEAAVDIWDYVEELYNEGLVPEFVLENELVEMAYTNQAETYDHITIQTQDEKVFVVIVLDNENEEILGHHIVSYK